MKSISVILVGMFLCAASVQAQETKDLYRNDFEKAEVGKLPDELLVLDGGFVVAEASSNKFMELPGAPLDSYGVLFGSTEKEGISATARIFGTTKGRRMPTFALGINGVGGYRMQVSPAKKLVELYRGDALKATAPFEWESGQWTQLRLQVRKVQSSWTIEGKVWIQGKSEPTDWTITATDSEELPAGRASVFGSPFSGTPIRFDDLAVQRLPKE